MSHILGALEGIRVVTEVLKILRTVTTYERVDYQVDVFTSLFLM